MYRFATSIRQIALDYADYRVDMLNRDGFHVSFRDDIRAWAEFVRGTGHPIVNPTFDPDQRDFDDKDCFWIEVSDAATGSPVACIADMRFEGAGYRELMRSGRLWYRDPLEAGFVPEAAVEPDCPALDGTVAQHGGLVVYPDWRGRGLAQALTRLCRALSVSRWNVNWHCGITLGHLAERGYPTRIYGYTHQSVCYEGYFPPAGGPARVYMTMISRAGMLDQMAGDLIVPGAGDEQPAGRAVGFA